MKVLIVIDVYGWAFDFVARGIKAYSKHDCTVKRWTDVTPEEKNSYDCLFCMNDSVWFAMGHNLQRYYKDISKKCLGIRGEESPNNRILKGWTIGAVNEKIYNELISKQEFLGVHGVYLTKNGVDTQIFKPPTDRQFTSDRFIVGWCGNPTQPLKRFHLLKNINQQLRIQQHWGTRFFVKDRERVEMTEFYDKIDAFISLSSHEGMPQSILEAAATKLPIVCTDAGGMAEFVDSEWVVPISPEHETVRQMNDKLEFLRTNADVRVQVAERNLQKVLSEWAWNIRVRDYDEMFNGAC